MGVEMRKYIFFTYLFLLLIGFQFGSNSYASEPVEDNFAIGARLLKEGNYEKTFGEDAKEYFKKAFNENKTIGPKIAKLLLQYSDELGKNGDIYTLIGKDAKSIMDDAIFYDVNIKSEVVSRHCQYLKFYLDNKDYNYSKLASIYINNLGEGKEAYEILVTHENSVPVDSDVKKFIKIFQCMNEALSKDPDRIPYLSEIASLRSLYLYENGRVRDAVYYSKECSDVIDDDESTLKTVAKYRNIAKNDLSSDNIGQSIRLIDEILYYFPDQTDSVDQNLLDQCISEILLCNDNNFVYLYDNFKSLLSLHFFDNCPFEFLEENRTIDDSIEIFSDIYEVEETSYLFFDTSRLLSKSRGMILTDEAIYWKNLTGDAKRIGYDNIDSVTLIYEKGISLTGWKLRFNQDENLELRLSRISDESILPFTGALLYFSNLNRTNNFLSLDIPAKEKEILDGSIWERHNGVIITTAVVATAVVTYYATKDSQTVQNAQAAVINGLSTAARVTASGGIYIAKRLRYAPKSLKAGFSGTLKSLKHFDIYKNGVKIGTAKLKDLYKKKNIIKMPFASHKSNKDLTARGFLRDKNFFWNAYKKLDKNGLSQNNINRINAGKSPIVDKKWIEVYKTHKDFIGETLEHHHLNHGSKAIAIPTTLHRGATNSAMWHSIKNS